MIQARIAHVSRPLFAIADRAGVERSRDRSEDRMAKDQAGDLCGGQYWAAAGRG